MAFIKAKALQEAEKLVSQGKIPQAIDKYIEIAEKEPSDLNLLNTIGDLYVLRQKNVAEGLKWFYKLAAAYVRDSFTVKAIAIYKKISKLDQNTVDPLLKLAELYMVQGLNREAREQYAQAVEFYRKKNQNDKALEVLRKVVQVDPENAPYRTRLAELCEQLGRKFEAAQAYLEAAEVALRRGDSTAAAGALKKAGQLDATNPRIQLLRAKFALKSQRLEEVEEIIHSVPGLSADPEARQLLLEVYLGAQKLEEAKKLVVEVFRSNPANFTPLANFSGLCIEKGDFDAAYQPLAEVADELIQQKTTTPLMEALRQIWNKSPQHIPTLELLYRVCERTADEFTLPEVLEALGHAYVQAENLEKGEAAYQKLIKREPQNEHYKGLLKQVQQKLGKEVVLPAPQDVMAVEGAFTPEAGPAAPAVSDAEQAAMVREALENSDLFSRYGLVDKAVAELEKVLGVYPDQVDIHQRIFEISQKTQPGRAGQAAGVLARTFAQRGDLPKARKYEALARQYGASVAPPEVVGPPPPPIVEVEAPPSAPTPELAAAEFDLTTGIPGMPVEEAPAAVEAAAAPQEIPLDIFAPQAATEVAAPAAQAPAEEFDLSTDLEAMTAPTETAARPAAEAEAPAFNYEESRVEIDFYLENGFVDEARKAVEALEAKFPGNPQLAELRQRVEARTGVAAQPAAPPEAVPEPEAALPTFETIPAATEPVTPAAEEWELPSAFAESTGEVQPAAELALPSEVPARPLPVVESAAPAAPPAPAEVAAGGDLLGSLAGDLASSLEGIEAPAPAASPGGEAVSPLSGLLEELDEGAAEPGAKEDPETHYNLGVAFREMGLLDEAIGEFQKVTKSAQKGQHPPNFLQACILLAVCFTDKQMPAVAARWYARALELPDLHEEAALALQYDLGVAYEQAGEPRKALEKFTEVYSQNIDFRDVAEKIRVLQQKVS